MEDIICPGCGAVINPETLEATFPDGSDAANIERLQNEVKTLKNKLMAMAQRYNQMRERKTDSGTQRPADTSSRIKFPWE